MAPKTARSESPRRPWLSPPARRTGVSLGFLFKQIGIAGATRRPEAKMLIGLVGRHAPARAAHDVALLDQIRFDDILERTAFFRQRRRERFHADRTAFEVFDDHAQQSAIGFVETER